MRSYTGHVVSHTHWDRAWYWTFEESRARLCDLVDGLLVLLQREPRYRHFVLDGQLALLDDYLAIRPAARERLCAFVRGGRLSAGPLYVLPDCFIPAGESLLRNFEAGARAAARLRIPRLPLAYLPDPFGLPEQLPQILAGLGLQGVFFTRGLGDEADRLGSDFCWSAPDGSAVLATVLLGGGYCNLARLGAVQQPPHSNGRTPPPDVGDDVGARALAQLERTVAALAPVVGHGHLLLANGCDHLPPQPELPALLDELGRRQRRVRLRHGTLEGYHRAVRAAVRRGGFSPPAHQGELRGARHAFILSGVLSARADLKLAHRRAETLLLRWAEPLLALSGRHGDQALLEHAWRELLLCQPHDDICGCSVDAVHADDLDRLRRVEQLGDVLTMRSALDLGNLLQASAGASSMPRAVLVNPLPWPQQRVVALPEGWRGARDAHGVLPAQRATGARRCWAFVRLPALSAALLQAGPAPRRSSSASPAHGVTAPGSVTVDVTAAGVILANEHLRASVGLEGELTLALDHGGLTFPGLAWLEDEGDAGDTYDFAPPAAQRVLRGFAAPPRLRVLERGPWRATVELAGVLALPQGLTRDRRARSRRLRASKVVLRMTLDAGSRWLAAELSLDNRVDDHRLRLGLRLSDPARVLATTPFALTERSVEAPAATSWTQPPPATHPCSGWSVLQGPSGGLACIAPGLHEVEPRRAGAHTELLLTLLRSVRWLSRADLSTRPGEAGPCWPVEGARQRGPLVLRWALLPFAGDAAQAGLAAAAAAFETPPRAFPLTGSGSAAVDDRARARSLEEGLLELHHPAVDVTSLRPGPDGSVELRLVNLARQPLEVALSGAWLGGTWRRCSLAGRPAGRVDLRRLALGAAEIATLRLRR